jgi:hypothetical protein
MGVSPDAPTMIRMAGPGSALPGDAMPPAPAHTIMRSGAVGSDSMAGINSAQPRSVYGQIAGPEQLALGTDGDTLFVTITY